MAKREGEPAAAASTRSKIVGPALAAVATGLSGYVVLVVTARSLSRAENAHFLVYWGLQYMVFGTLVGITLESTRSIHRAESLGPALPPAATLGRRPMAVLAGAIALTVAAGLAATSPAWAPALLGTQSWIPVAGLAVGTVLFGLQSALSGALVGRSDVGSYARVLSFDAGTRLALVGLVALLAPTLAFFALAASLTSGAWLLLTARRGPVRAAVSAIGSEPSARQVARLLGAMGSAGASALLVVGFPVLVALTSTHHELAGAAPVLLAVSLTRAPLMLPLSIYQNVVVTHVAERGAAALRGPALLTVGISLFGAALAYVIGPWALEVVKHGYVVAPGVLAGLVLAAGCTALITLSGAATLTTRHPAANLLGWLVAAAAGTALLTTGLPLDTRIVVALIAGPSLGAILHVIALRPRRAI